MTVDVFPGLSQHTVAGVGPYNIGHEYTEGSISVIVISAAGSPVLDPADYTVSPVAGADGDVTLDAGVAATYAGESIVLGRITSAQQGWAGLGGSRDLAAAEQMDRTIQAVQDLGRDMASALRLPFYRGAMPALDETADDRAARHLVFSEDGAALEVGQTAAEMLAAAGEATADNAAAAAAAAAAASGSETAASESAGASAGAAATAVAIAEALGYFDDRAAAEAANVAAVASSIRVLTPSGAILDYRRNTRGTVGQALQTADGQWWMPAVPWMITPNHWKENPTAWNTVMVDAVQAAVDYAADLAGVGPLHSGGRVNLLGERYRFNSTVSWSNHGIVLYGAAGDNGSRIDQVSATASTISVVAADPTGAGGDTTAHSVEGGGIENVAFYWIGIGVPTAGAHVSLDRATRFQVRNCRLIDHYVQIHFKGVGEKCSLEFCDVEASHAHPEATTDPAADGSALVKVTSRVVVETHASGAYQASGGGDFYTECNTVQIFGVNAVASLGGAQDCFYFDSFDGISLVGGHSNGATRSCLTFAPLHDGIPMTSFHAIGHHNDPKPSNTDYGVLISDLNGAGGATTGDLNFTGCGLSGAQVSSVVINMQCKRVQFFGGYMKSAKKSHVVINHDDAEEVLVDGVHLFTANTDTGTYANAPAIHLVRGKRAKVVDNKLWYGSVGIKVESTMASAKVRDNGFTGFSGLEILLPTGMSANVEIGANDLSTSDVVASATNVSLFPGRMNFVLTGVVPVATIRDGAFGSTATNCAWDKRIVEITAGASAAFTVYDQSHGSGDNISLRGDRSVSMIEGDRLRLQYSAATGFWHEIWRLRQPGAAVSVADDFVTSYVLPEDQGFVRIYAEADATVWAMFHYRADAGNEAINGIGSGSGTTLTTGALTGTDGVDGDVTVSVAAGVMYIENRSGGTLGFRFEASEALRAA